MPIEKKVISGRREIGKSTLGMMLISEMTVSVYSHTKGD